MKPLLLLMLALTISNSAFSQFHIAPCNGSADHRTVGICYGYAIGRAAGRNAGSDPCPPETYYPSAWGSEVDIIFDQEYFHKTGVSNNNLTGLSVHDVVVFKLDHAAYVTTINSPLIDSDVSDYAASFYPDKIQSSTIRIRTGTFDSVKAYYTRIQIPVTVETSPPGGMVSWDGGASEVGGLKHADWWVNQRTFSAERYQTFNNQLHEFDHWLKPDNQVEYSWSIQVMPKKHQKFTAYYNTAPAIQVPSQQSLAAALAAAVPGQVIVVSGPQMQTVSSGLTVNAGVTLILNAGSGLSVTTTSARILVFGELHVLGTQSAHVTIDGSGTTPRGYPYAPVVIGPGGTASLQYTDFRNTDCLLTFWSSGSSIVEHCTFSNFSNSSSSRAVTIYNCAASIQISGCTISGANSIGTGIYANQQGQGTLIQGNSISGCSVGIQTYGSAADLKDNQIHANAMYGIQADNVSTYAEYRHNDVRGSAYGVSLISSSPWVMYNTIIQNGLNVFINGGSPQFATSYGELDNAHGHNIIAYAPSPLLKAQNYAGAYLGYGGNGGYNSLYETDLPHLWAENHTNIWADNNCWGQEGPTAYADGTSNALTYNPLWFDPNEDPLGFMGKTVASSSSSVSGATAAVQKWSTASGVQDSFEAELRSAISLSTAGQYSKASEGFLKVIGSPSALYAPLALLTYHSIMERDEPSASASTELRSAQATLVQLLDSLRRSSTETTLRPFALELIARSLAMHGELARANDIYELIVNCYPNTSHEESALYNQALYHLNVTGDARMARELSTALEFKYPKRDLAFSAATAVASGVQVSSPLKDGEVSISSSSQPGIIVEEPFPNPFNPSASIKLSLIEQSTISVKVYDILGRHIVTLLSGDLTGGVHQATWDASEHPSGLYFCRIVARSSDGQCAVVVRRLLLAK